MNFMEAVKEMKEGKKVRKKSWGKDISIWANRDVFCYYNCNDGKMSGCSISDVEATDWEIYEEEKCKYCNESIKIRNPTGICDHLYYPENVNKDFPKHKSKTLSDKFFNPKTSIKPVYNEEDVKQALKEFLEYLYHPNSNVETITIEIKAKEIFGERLVS